MIWRDLSLAQVREGPGGLFVEGLSSHPATSVQEVLSLLELGARAKSVAATALNRASSRGHTVFTLRLRRALRGGGEAGGARAEASEARLTFVDLAGSERTSRTHAEGVHLDEAKSINRSLTALGARPPPPRGVLHTRRVRAGGVVSALASTTAAEGGLGSTAGAFVPWRDSKLTRLLQAYLGTEASLTLILARACTPRLRVLAVALCVCAHCWVRCSVSVRRQRRRDAVDPAVRAARASDPHRRRGGRPRRLPRGRRGTPGACAFLRCGVCVFCVRACVYVDLGVRAGLRVST